MKQNSSIVKKKYTVRLKSKTDSPLAKHFAGLAQALEEKLKREMGENDELSPDCLLTYIDK